MDVPQGTGCLTCGTSAHRGKCGSWLQSARFPAGFEPEDPGRGELHTEDLDTSGAMDSFLSLRVLKKSWSQEREGTCLLVLQPLSL